MMTNIFSLSMECRYLGNAFQEMALFYQLNCDGIVGVRITNGANSQLLPKKSNRNRSS